MAGVLTSVVIVAVMIHMLIKRYQPQFVLFGGGLLLLFIAMAMGFDRKLSCRKAPGRLAFSDLILLKPSMP